MEGSGAQGAVIASETPVERPRMSAKDVLWKVVALIVVAALAILFVMIGMKLAWIGG